MPDITFERERRRAVARDEGKEIGESTFSTSEKIWIIDHTFVDKAYGGQGIARRLVDAIVAEARQAGIKLTATCPYAAKLFKEEQYRDVAF